MTDIKTIKHLYKVVSVAKNTGIDALIVSYNMMVNTGKGGEACKKTFHHLCLPSTTASWQLRLMLA